MQFSLDGKDTIDIDTACLVGANLLTTETGTPEPCLTTETGTPEPLDLFNGTAYLLIKEQLLKTKLTKTR